MTLHEPQRACTLAARCTRSLARQPNDCTLRASSLFSADPSPPLPPLIWPRRAPPSSLAHSFRHPSHEWWWVGLGRAPPGPHPRAYTHQPIWRSNLMDCDIVIEGVGEIDARCDGSCVMCGLVVADEACLRLGLCQFPQKRYQIDIGRPVHSVLYTAVFLYHSSRGGSLLTSESSRYQCCGPSVRYVRCPGSKHFEPAKRVASRAS